MGTNNTLGTNQSIDIFNTTNDFLNQKGNTYPLNEAIKIKDKGIEF